MSWYVYIVRCGDDTLYTGVARDVHRRLGEHNGHRAGGARYTRARRPVRLAYCEPAASRAEAGRREAEIRRLGRAGKLELIAGTASQ